MSFNNAFIEGIHVTEPIKQGREFANSNVFANIRFAKMFANDMWENYCKANSNDNNIAIMFYGSAYYACLDRYNFRREVDTPVGSFNTSWKDAERDALNWLEIESNLTILKEKKKVVKKEYESFHNQIVNWDDPIAVDIKLKILSLLSSRAYLL